MNMMVRKVLLISILSLFVSVSFAQKKEKIKGDRNVTSKETNINSFNRIVVGEKFKIDLIEGSSASVFVEADDNLHDVIDFSVTDSVLSFKTSKKITSSKKLNIKVVYTKTLKQIETMDAGEISSLTSLNLDEVVLINSGTSRAYLNIKTQKFKHINSEKAKVKLNLTAANTTLELGENSKLEALINSENIEVDMFQRSEAKIEGEVSILNINTDNSSSFIGSNLTSTSCQLICELDSDAAVQVTESLTIEASGSSQIYIYDNPKITINKFTDTAKLHKKELKK